MLIDALMRFVRAAVVEKYMPGDQAAGGSALEDTDDDAEGARRAPRGRGRVVEDGDLEAAASGSSSGTDSEGESSSGEDGGAAGGGAPAPREYTEPPERRRDLRELLLAAGYGPEGQASPETSGIEIRNIITCNSDRGGEGSLFVCVDDEEGGADGHEWADEAVNAGAVAVVAARPIPGCLLPVVVIPDLLTALGRLAAEFYGEAEHARQARCARQLSTPSPL